MGCGSGGCSSGKCSSGGCNKLNSFDWLADMELPPHMKPFDVMEVRFKGTRKEFYRNTGNHDVTLHDMVVVEAENGYDIGQVSMKGELVKLQLKKHGLRPEGDFRKIARRASDNDVARWKENKELEVPTMYKARTIALQLGLKMKLSDVEYQGDKRKAIFYYTAEERVDFRELIKKLADAFKVRIEMKQIGYRHEAGRLGGIGSCGRELCCSTWLTDFKVVTTGAARYQNLSLNPLKLSGQCGRLKCCLNYELEVYTEALRDFPKEDDLVLEFADGQYRSVKTDILKRMIWFAPRETQGDWKGLTVDKVKEYRELNKQGIKPEVVVVKPQPKVVALDFQNDMGTESLTRLDERKGKGKKKSKSRGRGRDGREQKEGGPESRQAKPEGQQQQNQRGDRPQNQQPRGDRNRGNRPEGQNQQPRGDRNPGNKPDNQNRPPRGDRNQGNKPDNQNRPPRGDRNPDNKPDNQNRPPRGDRNQGNNPNPQQNRENRGPRPDNKPRENRPPRNNQPNKPDQTPPAS